MSNATTTTPHPARADRFVSGVADYVMTLPASDSIGESLKSLRQARGLTQQQLAQRLGVEQTHVSRIESRPDNKLSTILAYLNALGSELAELHVRFNDGARLAVPLPKQ